MRIMSLARPSAALASLASLVALACGDSQSTTTPSDGSATPSASSSAQPEVGLSNPTCLSYLEKTKACIQKAPESEREQRTKAIVEIEKMWTEQSQTADGRKRLETACSAALKQFEATGSCQ